MRSKYLRFALWVSVFSVAWSGIVGLIAVTVAVSTGALSLLGFGVDAVIDAAASITLIWRFRIEASQPDRADQVERAAERVIGIALITLAFYLALGSVNAILSGTHPTASPWALALLLASIAVLPGVARAKYVLAGELGSPALRLDSILTLVAALLAVISLGSLILADAIGLWWADAAAALIVAAIIVREGFSSFRASAGP